MWVFITIILLLSCSAVRERLAIKECKFSLDAVTAHDFTFSDLKLDFEIQVKNPNKVDAVLDKFVYTFFVNETDVFTGTTGKGIRVPSGEASNFTTTITLQYSKIGGALVESIKLEKAAYKITAKAYITTILGEISYPVEIALH